MTLLERNDPAAVGADRVGNIDCFGERVDRQKNTPTDYQCQNPAVAFVARRYRLTTAHPAVVVELAGLGVHRG